MSQLQSLMNPQAPRTNTPLQKAVRSALVLRSRGIARLREVVPSQVEQWRLEGVADAEIVARLHSTAAEVVEATGNDPIDIVTGEHRSVFIADEITSLVESLGYH